MASLCLVEEYGNIFNFFFDNCDCNQCNRMEERVDAEASLEFESIGVVESLRPKTLDKISEMQTGVSEKTPFANENQKKEIDELTFENTTLRKDLREGKGIAKDGYLEIKFNDRNQVDDKIVWGLGGGFLPLHSSFV